MQGVRFGFLFMAGLALAPWGCGEGGGGDGDAQVIVPPDAAGDAGPRPDGGAGGQLADTGPEPDAGPSPGDTGPAADMRLPGCGNGTDDDSDGYTDFPDDPGCGSALDDDETDSGPALPQCADGVDNDRDGLVDLADSGCSSPADPREEVSEGAETPACADGEDNDGDGSVDFPLEPGCSAAGDDDEENTMTPPECANGRDDDEDGATDFPDDPGCQGVGDRDEADPPSAPACADGIDNDRDGTADYPEDRGCQSAADGSEAGSCGVNYDPVDIGPDMTVHGNTNGGRFGEEGSCGGRGAAERVYGYRVERRLEALEITTTAPEGAEEPAVETSLYVRRACLDPDTEVGCAREPLDGVAMNTLRLENPDAGEYAIFVDGASGIGGPYALTVTEVPLAQCLNELDDDADGRVDYPFDPGCSARSDRDEADEGAIPVCANDEDDDGDGLVDFPLDLGCEAAADNDEVDLCGQGVRIQEYPIGEPFMLGDTTGGTMQFQGSCVAGNGAESIVLYRNPFNARLLFSVDYEETVANTGLYVRTECTNARSELPNACSAGTPPVTTRGRVRIDRAPAGDYFLIIDHTFGAGGPWKLSAQVDRLPPGCADNADSDGDGLIDGDDPGCEGALDEDERDPPQGAARPACDNGQDDDADGVADYPFDVGCAAKGDPDEADPPPDLLPECANGVDDDDDDRTDFPVDPGCQARGDDAERNPVPAPRCSDGIDQDMDGLADYPFDPGCDAAGDPSEQDPDDDPPCSNHVDDDRDGLVDFPFDPGCDAASDRDEADPAVLPACRNALDDDMDGRIDYPRDPGCRFAADPDEADPNFPPACANGRDDDQDGRIDYPDDIGCQAAFDGDESNVGRVVERCRDGADNDGDGTVDLADVGCQNARDNDEGDEGDVPACANGEDDDADGLIDWPEDDGCAAHGAVCEQAGFGLCDGVCIDLVADAANCGRCGRACNEGVECIEGVCGGLFIFEGVAQDVPEADLDGWEQCHSDNYAESTPIADFLNACQGDYILYGCRQNGAASFTLMAMGERQIVFQDTGDQGNAVNTTNGVSFYFSQSYSIGFVAEGSAPQRNSCDTGQERGELRMCWHTGRGQLNSGYRCGNNFLNGNAGWERVIFTSR